MPDTEQHADTGPILELEPDEYRAAGEPSEEIEPKPDHFDKIMLALIVAFVGAWIRGHS